MEMMRLSVDYDDKALRQSSRVVAAVYLGSAVGQALDEDVAVEEADCLEIPVFRKVLRAHVPPGARRREPVAFVVGCAPVVRALALPAVLERVVHGLERREQLPWIIEVYRNLQRSTTNETRH